MIDKLINASNKTGNIFCFGLDPVLSDIPEQKTTVEATITDFMINILDEIKKSGNIPAAFKPNLGFYLKNDKPYLNDFSGSKALVNILQYLQSEFDEIPIILDFKTADIGKSSAQYAKFAFNSYAEKKIDAVTVHPYMGFDSVEPYLKEGFCYILTRTSNPGAKDFQNLFINNNSSDKITLYKHLTDTIIKDWNNKHKNMIGMVVGATNPDELLDIIKFCNQNNAEIPLLIPGIGTQGGSLKDLMQILNGNCKNKNIHRINASSSVLYAYKKTNDKLAYAKLAVEEIYNITSQM